MTADIAAPFITGLFVGGIITELRWVVRMRHFRSQIGLTRSAEVERAMTFAADAQSPLPQAQSSQSLRSLQDHLTAEAPAVPIVEPADTVKREK